MGMQECLDAKPDGTTLVVNRTGCLCLICRAVPRLILTASNSGVL